MNAIERMKQECRALRYNLLQRVDPDGAKAIAKAYPNGCQFLDRDATWRDVTGGANPAYSSCYRLKPGYKPEPEYESWEVFLSTANKLCVRHPNDARNILVGEAVSEPGFVEFFYDVGPAVTVGHIGLIHVATAYRNGHEVYARFVKNLLDGKELTPDVRRVSL